MNDDLISRTSLMEYFAGKAAYCRYGSIERGLWQAAYEATQDEPAASVVPLTWEEAMGDDAFLEIKGDEFIDAALNLFACCTCGGVVKDGFVYYETHNTNELKLMECDYGKTWRCWPCRPTDEERFAAKWGDEDDT